MKELRNNELNTRKPCPPSPRVLCRNYSDIKTINLLHNPHFITGFSDAEASFIIFINKLDEYKLGWCVAPQLSINLHLRDKAVLTRIQSFFGVGAIRTRIRAGKSTAIYSVQSLKDLTNIIIPHFKQYALLTQKRTDFEFFFLWLLI